MQSNCNIGAGGNINLAKNDFAFNGNFIFWTFNNQCQSTLNKR